MSLLNIWISISIPLGILLAYPFEIVFFGDLVHKKSFGIILVIIICMLFWPILIIIIPIVYLLKHYGKITVVFKNKKGIKKNLDITNKVNKAYEEKRYALFPKIVLPLERSTITLYEWVIMNT